MRSATKTSTKVNAAQSVHIFKGIHLDLYHSACNEGGLPVMAARRNMPKSALRMEEGWQNMPPDYYPNVPVSFNSCPAALAEPLFNSMRYGS
jgi:hypothetical protein